MRVFFTQGQKTVRLNNCQRLPAGLQVAGIIGIFCCVGASIAAQTPPVNPVNAETTEQKVEQLTNAVVQAQAQMEAYQKQLVALRQQLEALQKQMRAEKGTQGVEPEPAIAATDTASSASAASSDEVRERQAIDESQIATLDASKVETESKYPLKVTGLLLFNAFVNTRQVDVSASPAYAIPGAGSTGFSVRQTVLGFDARGPHLWNAASRADLRVDFFAGGTLANYAASGILRLRTAHAVLDWKNAEAFVAMDRSILSPNEPSSLVAVAQPELAWTGNLWSWNPQIGVSRSFAFSDSSRIKAEAAFIDTSDPVPPGSSFTPPAVTQTERSRWPGTEARIAFQHDDSGTLAEMGVGGYFSPHRTADGNSFNAWAGTLDMKAPLGRYFEITANAYRGQALAGLGGGGYVNYYDFYEGTSEYARALDDVGGWSQLKARPGQRFEINAGFGIDNPFAKEIVAAVSSLQNSSYAGLARNRAVFSNVIYSPSSYLLFSLEYRHLWSNFASGQTNPADVIGVGAGYRF